MDRKIFLVLVLVFSLVLVETWMALDQIQKRDTFIQQQAQQIAILESKKLELQNTICILNDKVSSLESDKAELQKLKGQLEEEISELDAELGKVKPLRPTREQLANFLIKDLTNEKLYAKDFYVCSDYAIDVRANARQQGWNISVVFVWWKTRGSEYAHALNGAYLADGTLVWIEPQKDRIYSADIEKALAEDFGPEYAPTKIEELLVVW